MPLKRYGVVKGKVIDARREERGDTPHYQLHLLAGDTHFRVPVNVKSKLPPSELLFLVNDNFQHPLVALLPALPVGYLPIESRPGGLALDFIRGNLFNRLEMRPLPFELAGHDNDLNDKLEHYVQRAILDPEAVVYAFGERWGEESQADKIFHFRPGNGIHDIHMNQGNAPSFRGDDGVWQDGALLLHLPSTGQYVAIFLAFQSQAWHTDDQTGHALIQVPEAGEGRTPTPAEPDFIVRIVGALVNPVGPAPEMERVILLNTSPEPIDLDGWSIADRMKDKHCLEGVIEAGSPLVVNVAPPVELGNRGGIITLLDAQGLKVDGVSYTAEQARREGWVITF